MPVFPSYRTQLIDLLGFYLWAALVLNGLSELINKYSAWNYWKTGFCFDFSGDINLFAQIGLISEAKFYNTSLWINSQILQSQFYSERSFHGTKR